MTILNSLRRLALRTGLDIQRAHETGEARIVRSLLRRNVDCVLDVGANRGQYGTQLRRFGYTGDIRSFEPVSASYRELAREANRDPHWLTWRLALGSEDGTAALNIAGNEASASSSLLELLPRHAAAQPDVGYVDAIKVPIRRLDTIWSESVPDGATTFIKLDVQGFEGAVLDGATESLQRTIGLQLEMSLVPLYEGAPTMRELLERTENLGMQMVHVEPGFADPGSGELLQIDGVFFRSQPG